MEEKVHIKVHGRGNAWPIPLGEEHPFYDRKDVRDLANAAFSLEWSRGEELLADILVDAGHGTIQSLLSGSNRIPHTICLTHGHMDHTLGVDWVAQSFWRQNHRELRYPLYAAPAVFRFLIQSFPQLEELLDYRLLQYGEDKRLDVPGAPYVTAFPVYHGPHARGASMLLFRAGEKRILFTGDLITPLLRQEDYEKLVEVDQVVVDCNNRFPWPRTNHWSFAGSVEDPMRRHKALSDFLDGTQAADFLAPHKEEISRVDLAYLEKVAGEWDPVQQPFTILEFCRRIRPKQVNLVHYSGAEDKRYHEQEQLNTEQLQEWVTALGATAGLATRFHVPLTGEEITV